MFLHFDNWTWLRVTREHQSPNEQTKQPWQGFGNTESQRQSQEQAMFSPNQERLLNWKLLLFIMLPVQFGSWVISY